MIQQTSVIWKRNISTTWFKGNVISCGHIGRMKTHNRRGMWVTRTSPVVIAIQTVKKVMFYNFMFFLRVQIIARSVICGKQNGCITVLTYTLEYSLLLLYWTVGYTLKRNFLQHHTLKDFCCCFYHRVQTNICNSSPYICMCCCLST